VNEWFGLFYSYMVGRCGRIVVLGVVELKLSPTTAWVDCGRGLCCLSRDSQAVISYCLLSCPYQGSMYQATTPTANLTSRNNKDCTPYAVLSISAPLTCAAPSLCNARQRKDMSAPHHRVSVEAVHRFVSNPYLSVLHETTTNENTCAITAHT
jgi:hypothetical protein